MAVHCAILLLLAACASASNEARLTATENETVRLNCGDSDALAKLRHDVFDVTWRMNGSVVATFRKESKRIEHWVAGTRLQLDKHTFALTISLSQPTDSAHYQCNVQIRRTRHQPTIHHTPLIQLVVTGRPVPPQRPKATSFTSRSISVAWQPSDGHEPISSYGVVVISGGALSPRSRKVLRMKTNATSAVVSSLKPYTTYQFHVFAVNAAGQSALSPLSFPIRTKAEPPVGAPLITSVANGTNGSLLVRWQAPPNGTLHGPLVSYRLRAKHLATGAVHSLDARPPLLHSFELTDLAVYSLYEVSVAAYNGLAHGPPDKMLVLTAEGVPTAAPILSGLTVLSSDAIRIKWIPPPQINGRLAYYTVYYWLSANHETQWAVNVHDVYIRSTLRAVMEHLLKDLEPYQKYCVCVSASTHKGEGPSSDESHFYTDTAAPSSPSIANVSVADERRVTVRWRRPATFFRSVDAYSVRIYSGEDQADTSRLVNTSSAQLTMDFEYDKRYVVSVKAYTQSIVNADRQYSSAYSSEEAFMITPLSPKRFGDGPSTLLYTSACEPRPAGQPRGTSNVICDQAVLTNAHYNERPRNDARLALTVSLVASLAAFAALSLCVVGVFFVWRRRARKSRGNGVTIVNHQSSHFDKAPIYEEGDRPAIPVALFSSRVDELRRDGDAGFAAEFQALTSESLTAETDLNLSCDRSLSQHNKPKNRYVNILAYDQSRVILRSVSGVESSDYINANFIDGYDKARAYIATQAPLACTFGDFWRLVWEQRSAVIVMITNVVERGRRKCDQYWPSDGAGETYGGQFHVRLLNESCRAYFAVRVFCLRNLRVLPVRSAAAAAAGEGRALQRPAERLVFHYHYTHWPDHGVPASALPALAFVRRAAAAWRVGQGPVVVHCSAGVGRSGTFVVVDAMLRQVAHRSSVNPFAYLRHIRRQRKFLVQNEEQYIFCHLVLLEAIRNGVTEVSTADLAPYIDYILPEVDAIQNKTLLEIQYNLVRVVPAGATFTVANLPCNINKNRNMDIIPADSDRVRLTAEPAIDGSDYINATYLQGYHRLDEFIVTQWPLESTVGDFWRMIWDCNCQTIVLLCDSAAEPLRRFWPRLGEQAWSFGPLTLSATAEAAAEEEDAWGCVELLLQSAGDDFQLPCRLVLGGVWPDRSGAELDDVWALVGGVRDCHLQYQGGATVVLDRCGGTDAATFCALVALHSQMDADGAVDVYSLARLHNERRPGLYPRCEDYYFLYECVRTLVQEEASLIDHDLSGLRPSTSVPSGLRAVLASSVSPVVLPMMENGGARLSADITL